MYLFLDIDGVMHPWPADEFFLPECCAVLEKLIKSHSSIEIVICSSWRDDYSLDDVRSFFPKVIAGKIIDSTGGEDHPHIGSYRSMGMRERQIQAWMQENAPDGKWFAIDDTSVFYDTGAPLFITDDLTGLQVEDLSGLNGLIKRVEDTPLELVQERRACVLNKKAVPEHNLNASPGFTYE